MVAPTGLAMYIFVGSGFGSLVRLCLHVATQQQQEQEHPFKTWPFLLELQLSLGQQQIIQGTPIHVRSL